MRFRCGVADNVTTAINSHLILASTVDCVAHIMGPHQPRLICEPIYFRWKNAEHKLSQYVCEIERHIQLGVLFADRCFTMCRPQSATSSSISLSRSRAMHSSPTPLGCFSLLLQFCVEIPFFWTTGSCASLVAGEFIVNHNRHSKQEHFRASYEIAVIVWWGPEDIQYIEFLTVHLLLSARNNWSIFPCAMVCVDSVCVSYLRARNRHRMHIL